VIPRRFDAFADALAGYAAVISGDSLPAHLAEYRGTPAFVASPVHNRYWLPKRAFLGEHWGLIHERAELMVRLRRFLGKT
jgi:ADP-heptose:LPS heptosyltransferase